ncbi:MAG: pentapeptide repeat-containing protein [Fuerstiella sp.]|nr:pentapeptide repeat-containing protein [Fuerstiella sp.]
MTGLQIKNKAGTVLIEDAGFAPLELYKADLRWTDLRGANLRGADLREADLRWTNLREADLRWADLCGADLRWADLRGADLSGADLPFRINTDTKFFSSETAQNESE